MIPDLTPYFEAYQKLAAAAEQAFDKIKEEYSDAVKCGLGCTDCCYAIFDVSFVEAMYINAQFNIKFSEKVRYDMMEKANRIDRKLTKIKRNAFKELESGKDENTILTEIAQTKVQCPLLDDNDGCSLYESRPITCRLYGIPTAIGGTGRTCGLSGFKPGEAYPTVHLDKIHQQLYDISAEMVKAMKSSHIKMAEILMPVSMAIITDFNEEYLGIQTETDEKEDK